MSDTLSIPHPETGEHAAAPGEQPRPFWQRHVWWLVAIGIVVLSAGVVRWADTRPGYDPYGWLIWGYQLLHWNLNLGGAPSWKPLPLLFTLPFSLFGHDALWLWMTTAVAVSFAGSIFAGRVAFRIVDDDGTHRAAAIAAAAFAGLGMYVIQDDISGVRSGYLHYLLSVQSDPMIVTFVLAAIDMHMLKHRRWVLVMLGLASLGRPEAWPPLGLYMLWMWVGRRDLRAFIVAEVALIAFLWFGVPWITNGRPFVAGDLAQGSPRELKQNKIIGTIDRFKTLNLWPVWILALFATAWAGSQWRRARGLAAAGSTAAQRLERENRTLVLWLAGLVIMWEVVEAAFALHGWPAVPRYIFPPAVVAILLGAIGLGWLITEAPRVARAPSWAGAVVGVVLVACMIPGVHGRLAHEHKDIVAQAARTRSIDRLAGFIDRLGGPAAVARCGRPVANVEYVSIVGWLTHINDGKVGHRPQFELHQNYPVVLITRLPNGWAAYAWHTAQSKFAACAKAMDRAYAGGPLQPDRAPHPDPVIPNSPTPG